MFSNELLVFNVIKRGCLEKVPFKEPPCHQIRTYSSWFDRSSGPTSRHHLTTSPRSSLASLHLAGWTGSAYATGSTWPEFHRQRGTSPQSGGRWLPARPASFQGGRSSLRSQPGPLAPFDHGALPCVLHVLCTSWMLRHNLPGCCTPGNTCIQSVVPSRNLWSREKTRLVRFQTFTTSFWIGHLKRTPIEINM